MQVFTRIMAVAGIVLIGATSVWAVNIETVPVGNPGNDDDIPVGGYGGVAYTYNIGKYEVTAGQYTEFLNAVAGVDTYGLYSTYMWDPRHGKDYGCKIERYAGSGTVGDPYKYRVATDYANRPVNYVSFWDTCRFANWLPLLSHSGR